MLSKYIEKFQRITIRLQLTEDTPASVRIQILPFPDSVTLYNFPHHEMEGGGNNIHIIL